MRKIIALALAAVFAATAMNLTSCTGDDMNGSGGGTTSAATTTEKTSTGKNDNTSKTDMVDRAESAITDMVGSMTSR